MHDVDDLNSGYALLLLEQYLENPASVPDEWRELFESGHSELVATHPVLRRLLETMRPDGNGAAPAQAPPPAKKPPPPGCSA